MFVEAINSISREIYNTAKEKGWYEEERNFGETLALKHAELSEALEAWRVGDPESAKIPGFTQVEEEFADTVIRIFDTCLYRNYRIAEAILAKIEYNKSRPYRHGNKKC